MSKFLSIIAIFVSLSAMANDSFLVLGQIKVAPGENGGACTSGFVIEGKDFETDNEVLLCAQLDKNLNLGPKLAYALKKQKVDSKDLLEFLEKNGNQVLVNGEAVEDDIILDIFTAELWD